MLKLQESAFVSNNYMPLLSKRLKGYVPDGRQIGIACNKFPAGINQFTKTEVIQSGTVHYRGPAVRDNSQGVAEVSKFQTQVRN
jgi:hypothetical protein